MTDIFSRVSTNLTEQISRRDFKKIQQEDHTNSRRFPGGFFLIPVDLQDFQEL